ncbi:ABC transporter permease [Ramlibacter sp. PS4R-6]|uniref:ABC transporter permease n=1 Tax=Ramlibacter sp. PS4R-6 TaxID=3133438 RepID=UPI0030A0D52C
MLRLLRAFSWPALRHHPWLGAVAVLAVMLGVALAFSVHLINQSALDEFSGAVRATSGEPDVELRAAAGHLDERLFARVAAHPQAALANPVLEVATFAVSPDGQRRPLRVVGLDVLSAASLSPTLMPALAPGEDRLTLFSPGVVFLNAAARRVAGDAPSLRLQSGLALREARIAGSVAAAGPPLAVMDIAAAQDFFARGGELTRIDVRLAAGADRQAFVRSLDLPPGVVATSPADAAQRVGNLSRAYRVNLTVLALVALFTGAFLVYSVLALSVAQRAQQFALLGVMGLTARERAALVVAEAFLLGAVGSALGIALGGALAQVGLRALGGDLGGGYFPGVAPEMHWSTPAALLYGALGCAAAMAGGWLPARAAQHLPLAQALKGLGSAPSHSRRRAIGAILLAAGVACAFLPPLAGIPLGAYASVGLLLVGGIAVLPAAIALLYGPLAPVVRHRALPLLALERARRVRESAAIAVSGVVASLSLAVALTVMVASFRDSVARWLDVVLPADLYLRTAASSQSADTAWFPPGFAAALAQAPGVARLTAQRTKPLLFDPTLPPVVLLARDMDDAARSLPMVGDVTAVPAGAVPVYVSEAVVDLYGAKPGENFTPLARALGVDARFVVAGVWRDYVRQSGAVALARADFVRLTGDRRANDIQLWLAPGADAAQVQAAARGIARQQGGFEESLEFGSARELRAASLRIFDRSFAVTYWLQAVAIGIGLFGVAASFSAQVLARRKEFGLLAHLGFTRAQVLRIVAGEGAAWTAVGSIAGLALGLAVAVVLVHVVNPQSFHWTMDLRVPWERLLLLCAAVVVAGTLTARFAGSAAARRDAVLAVKEDW